MSINRCFISKEGHMIVMIHTYLPGEPMDQRFHVIR
jgi:hypothetical protein